MAIDPKKLTDLSAFLDGYKMGMYFDLVLTLMELRDDTALIEHHGCKNFWELMDKTQVGDRRARYLIGTVEKLKKLGYTENQMRELFDIFHWTKLKEIAKRIEKRVAPSTLRKQYANLTTKQLSGKLNGVEKKLFTAELSNTQHKKLMSLLKKKYGLVKKGKGQGNVAEAFGKMIDADT